MSLLQRGHKRAAKATPSIVRLIREMYDSGRYTQAGIAREVGLSVVQVGRITRRESWADLPEELTSEAIAASAERLMRTQDALARMGKEVTEAAKELTPGETKADRMVGELAEGVEERARGMLGLD